MTWTARVLTLFPAMFPGPLGASLAGRALDQGLWHLAVRDIRDFAEGKHRQVDDTPFGGGAGMVMRPDVVDRALQAVAVEGEPALYLTPRGRPLTQGLVRELAAGSGLTLLCGRYEGVDERLLEAVDAEEWSIGDYVLSGGELPALVMLDAIARLVPGVVGDERSVENDSFSTGQLDYPHYTRPAVWRERAVPEVLLSGHHGAIEQWRQAMAAARTRQRRPDLTVGAAARGKGKGEER